MKELTATVFDYSALDKDDNGKLLCLAREINGHKAKYLESSMEIGKAIATAHSILAKYGEGEFCAWCEAEFAFSLRSAYNYMNAWQSFGDFANVAKIEVSALYELASPKAPEKAVREAKKLADSGKVVTHKMSREILDKFRTAEARPKSSPSSRATGGGAALSSPAPHALPAEGTVSQTETGSQGSGGAADGGPCPHGGEHIYDDEACTRCHDPKPGISGGTSFNIEELTSESKDAFGDEAPEDLRLAFGICEGFDEQRKRLTAIKTWITQNINHPGAVVLASAQQRIRTDIDNADRELKFCKPHCVCVYCKNEPPAVANCNACKGLGWITQPIYEAAPKGMKRAKVRS